MSCEIYFVRHGETHWNRDQRIQGHADIPLNEMGRSQSLQLNQLLAKTPFSAAFASDLLRAKQTAEHIIEPRDLPIQLSPALRERGVGALEGMNKDRYEEMIAPFLHSKQALDHQTYLHTPWHPEVESVHSVFKRVTEFLFPLAAFYQKQSLLIVSHGGVIRSILDHIAFTPKKRWIVRNCGFIKIQVNHQNLSLVDFHDIFVQ